MVQMKKQDKYIVNDDLLCRYLCAEATNEERLQVEQWLAGNEANQKALAHYQLIMEESKALSLRQPGDVNKAWNNLKLKIEAAPETVIHKKTINTWLSIAAAILIVFSVSLFFYLKGPGQHELTTFSTMSQSKTDSLPDGSMVTLYKNSSLTYTADQYPNKRYLTLKGEAFFNVVHDKTHPFIIKVNDVLINVLGTSFNIRGIGDQTEIVVASGVVGVMRGSQTIKLNSSEKLLVTPGNANWKKETGSGFDLNQYPGLVKAMLKDPGKWPGLLQFYFAKNDTSTVMGKDRAIIRTVIMEIIRKKLVAEGGVRSFRLNDTALVINDQRQPDSVYRHFKAQFIKEPGYTIYFGGSPQDGKGIYFKPDSL
jgi:transmembrane sensor